MLLLLLYLSDFFVLSSKPRLQSLRSGIKNTALVGLLQDNLVLSTELIM